jgi:hypothetical protein
VPPDKSPWQTVLHETFTVFLAATILCLTVWMMAKTFASGAETFAGDDKLGILRKDAYERQKDLMLYGLSLLGTVTGYYLGRVPAERRADSAQRVADKAQGAAKDAQHEAAGANATAAKAIGEKEAATSRAAKANEDKDVAKTAGRELIRQAKQMVVDAAKGGAGPVRATLGDGGGTPGAATGPDMRAMQAAIERMETTLDRIG